MIRFVFRSAGFILLAVAFSGLVVDGTRSIAAHAVLQFSFGDLVAWAMPARSTVLIASLAHWPEPAQRLTRGLLAVPGWIVTGTAGLALLWIGRRAVRQVRVSRR